MEANEAKKPKRPRIGQPMGLGDNQNHGPESHYENSFNANGNVENTPADGERHEGFQHDRPYQPRNNYNRPQGGYQQRPGGYNRPQGGYQPRNNYGPQGGYNRPQRPGGYQPRPYNNRPPMQHDAPADGVATPVAEGSTPEQAQQPMQGGYQPRNNYNRPQGGYQQRPGGYNRPQGGYQPRNNYGQQGGYQQRPGGYNRPQGGYQPRNNYGQQGGYQQRPGGYNRPNQQGGYQPRNNYGQQGGYNNQQGGYMNNNRRPNGPGNRFQKGPIRQGKSFTPRPKRIEYELPLPDPDEKIRLNKFMANAGLCSRREADEFIQQGLVKVNGQVVTELGDRKSVV